MATTMIRMNQEIERQKEKDKNVGASIPGAGYEE
jgi:hypothetical protein